MDKHDLEKLNVAVFGTKPNHEDGMVGIVSALSRTLHGTEMEPGGLVQELETAVKKVEAHEITLYGTPENPVGIAKDVRTMKRIIIGFSAFGSACGAALVVMEFVSKVAPLVKQIAK